MTKRELKESLKDAVDEPNGVKKGKKFEIFFENYMAQQEGFQYLKRHCRSKVGELDYFYRITLSGHPLWKLYPYLFIECKNWKEPISSEKMDHFIRLVKAKTPFSCCGIYITTSHFSPEAMTTMRDSRIKDSVFILPIDLKDITDLIENGFKVSIQEKCDKVLARA